MKKKGTLLTLKDYFRLGSKIKLVDSFIPEELLIDIILSIFCNLPTTILEKLSQVLIHFLTSQNQFVDPGRILQYFFETLWIANGNT